MPAASARERSSSAGLLSIGQVLARLSPEFPTLTSSKLRFLEVQGIVTPLRTESGYRKFTPDDLERLRLALTLQRDHYLPLVVIREYLADVDAGRDPGDADRRAAAVDRAGAAPLPPRRAARRPPAPRRSCSTTRSARACSRVRTPTPTSPSRCCARSSRSTATASSRATCARCKQNAERDVALVESALAPLLRRTDAASRGRAGELASELAKRLDEVRAIFVRSALERLLS